MNLLSIPIEVIEDNLLPFLGWNDLLRFRRVCKAAKEMTSSYMRVNADRAPEIEINEHENKNFRAFLRMNIPTTRIYLSNMLGDEFYQKNPRDIAEFLKKYVPIIKHLRVKVMSLYCCDKEWDFLDSLVNLESFEAGYFGVGRADIDPEDVSHALKLKLARAKLDPLHVKQKHVIPGTFKQLRSIKIGQQEHIKFANITNRTGIFLLKVKELEYVALPFNSLFASTGSFTLPENYNRREILARVYYGIIESIEKRAERCSEKFNLKIFDFVNYHQEEGLEAADTASFGSHVFVQLCVVCNKYDVQLKNVSSLWFQQLLLSPELRSPELGRPVLSMVDVHHCVLPLDMPNLERIVIKATSKSSPGTSWIYGGRPEWPALKSLDITVNNKTTQYEEWNGREQRALHIMDTKFLLNFFFKDISRTNMTELRLNFTKPAGSVAVPKTEDIVASCPNLKKLEISSWPGTNKALTKLWSGLPGLEEVSLESCWDLGNVAFVGEDTRNPVFLKLAKLKKLSLKGLHQMPKISDTLFFLVICHLKLSHFTLTSDSPLISVTSSGVLSLLEGPFAKSIEKFSFRGWSLMNVPSDEFSKLEQKFRSYNML